MDTQFSVIVVGGGYWGTSIAYHLSDLKVKILLVEQNEIGHGASGRNFGNIQVQDMSNDICLQLALDSFFLWRSMEDRLQLDLEYRPRNSIIYAETQQEWDILRDMQSGKINQGLEVEFWNSEQLCRQEPFISPKHILGATVYREATINPFKVLYGFARRTMENGGVIMENTKVVDFIVEAGKVKGIVTSRGEFRSDLVILTTGAWTKQLARKLDVEIPIEYVYAEAFVTETLPSIFNSYFAPACFFIEAHGTPQVNTTLTATQTPRGNIIWGETNHPSYGKFIPDDNVFPCSQAHIHGIFKEVEKYFPRLLKENLIRSWGVYNPFTPDHHPVFGYPGPDGLMVVAAFKSTVIFLPVIGKIVAELLTRGKSSYDLTGLTAKDTTNSQQRRCL